MDRWWAPLDGNIVLGCLTMMVGLTIHCVAFAFLLKFLFYLDRKEMIKTSVFAVSSLLVMVMVILMIVNLLQMSLWAGLFLICGEFKSFKVAFYHSVVNFTSLGYGDIVMSENRRLLGSLEAAYGVLMFGLTTSSIFMILQNLMKRGLKENDRL